MLVKIIQQGSGPGSYPVGTILDVTDEEGRGYCTAGGSHSTPFAVPVVEDRSETADAPADKRTETRAETKPTTKADYSSHPPGKGTGRPRPS